MERPEMPDVYILLAVMVVMGLLTTAWVAWSVCHLPNLDDDEP
jgi:hypothetical protein